MELQLPPINDKEVLALQYRRSQAFKNRSEANRKKALKYWSDPNNRKRVDTKQAKAVDVFDLQGRYIRTYPSSRKAAEELFPDTKRQTAERCIRRGRSENRKKDYYLLSYKGYMFRTHNGEPHDIEPLPPRKHKPKGYHVNRRPDTYEYTKKPVRVTFDDGDTIDFPSVKDCAEAIKGTRAGIWLAMKQNRKYMKKYKIDFI